MNEQQPEASNRWDLPKISELTVDDIRGHAPLHCTTCGAHQDTAEALAEHVEQRHGGHAYTVAEDRSGYFPQYRATCVCGWSGVLHRARNWAAGEGRVHARGFRRDGFDKKGRVRS